MEGFILGIYFYSVKLKRRETTGINEWDLRNTQKWNNFKLKKKCKGHGIDITVEEMRKRFSRVPSQRMPTFLPVQFHTLSLLHTEHAWSNRRHNACNWRMYQRSFFALLVLHIILSECNVPYSSSMQTLSWMLSERKPKTQGK